ncbi:hypothetical protein HY448_02780 [Candidatus Pacearchaeota archaeon]|nr:hypothetical protein [Candidatus Pacearchaeota archaeon]
MAEAELTILQNWIVTKFILPYFLIFFITFAILQKTKVLSENSQLNALVAFVVGLIFVGFTTPKAFVDNMILFLAVALVVVFVGLMIYGFLLGEGTVPAAKNPKMMFLVFGIVIVAVFAAVVWAADVHNELIDALFYQPWSKTFWTNALFVLAIAGTLALVLRSATSKSG